MNKTPISIIIDDPAPLVHIYREHRAKGVILNNGETLADKIPLSFLERFCDTVERFGISGKFSIVPMPGCRGDIVHGIRGFEMSEVAEWLRIARTRLSPYFDFCPEILTHHKAFNLETGEFYVENEQQWASHQTRQSLARYISRALELMRDADITPTGITSPWEFGIEVEDNYVAAICDAFWNVLGKKRSWYFLHHDLNSIGIRPKVRYREGDCAVVEIVRTVNDVFWDTIECTRTDKEYIALLADKLITADGTAGQIIDALQRDCYPILVTHWQSLFSNGREVGLAALYEVALRIEKHLSDRVIWRNFSFLMEEAIDRSF